jgi:tRNA pseudouridine55 synthase
MLTEFALGSTILVDKPLHWTSFDAVNKLRWHLRKRLGVKKLKVGHAGTLDPLATGLLIICIGKNTKLIDGLMGDAKTYTGTILLGKTTPSYDLETEYNAEFPTGHITPELLEEVRLSFIGVQQQVPPNFSAKQVDGKRAYDMARAGKEFELKSNTIEIHAMQIDTSRFPEIDFEISCSKGTYIRSIAHDFGKKLGSGGTLIALRRTASGENHVDNAKSVDDWIALFETAEL